MKRGLMAMFVLVAGLLTSIETASAAPGRPCAPTWSDVSPPNPASDDVKLFAVDATSWSDVWVVGRAGDPFFHDARTLAEHWDGDSWTRTARPSLGGDGGRPPNSVFGDVDAVSEHDVWASGSLVAHWDGTAWDEVDLPDLGFSYGTPAVAALTESDVWLAGGIADGADSSSTLILHWNGHRWRRVPSPNVPGGSSGLAAIDAVAADDIWAVGSSYAEDEVLRPLALHWDGTEWTMVPTPTVAGRDTEPVSVDAASASDAWMVGHSAFSRTFAAHWDGSAWKVVPTPSRGEKSELRDIVAVSPGDAWAVGFADTFTRTPDVPGGALIEHWDGDAWRVANHDRRTARFLEGIAAVGRSSELWAVGGFGSYTSAPPHAPMAVRLCPVALTDDGPLPSEVVSARGRRAHFHVPETGGGTRVVDASGLGLFDSGELSAGDWYSYRYFAAGTFGYGDGLGHHGRVRIPVRVAPADHGLQVTWASRMAPDGLAYDVDVRPPGAPEFRRWLFHTAERGAVFDSTTAGTYEFRARLARADAAAASRWSPIASRTV